MRPDDAVPSLAEAQGHGHLRIRIGDPSFTDWAGLHRLLVDAFAFMAGRIDPPSSLEAMDAAALARKAAAETLVVVEDGERLVGCGFFAARGDALYLCKLAVAESHRRRGILRRIVAIAESRARAQAIPALELETRIELQENHTTFAALGFAVAGTFSHPGYDRPTSVLMRKSLNSAATADAPRPP